MGIGGRDLRLITSEDPQKRTMCGQMRCTNPSFGPPFFEQFTATTPWIVPETRNSMSPLSPVLWPCLARCARGKGQVASEGSNHPDYRRLSTDLVLRRCSIINALCRARSAHNLDHA